MKLFQLHFILFTFMITTMNSYAQEKILSLEDLIPGGSSYSKFTPKLKFATQWFGDKYTLTGRDTMYCVDPEKPDTKEILFTNKFLRELLSDENVNINQIKFCKVDTKIVASVPVSQSNKTAYIDPEKKQVIFEIPTGNDWANSDLCLQNKRIAFTKGNNLFISNASNDPIAITNEENKDIKCGTEVHRGEFGITKGTFWSPNGSMLAFYKKDEIMVGNYPLVNTFAREAELNNIKYPMAGMKSEQISVGIYDLQTNKTIYLKTGSPKDRYFTNISWSPDEKSIYIAEVNRGQDTCNFVRYNTQSGVMEAVLFQETNSKYVEPLKPAVFLKKTPAVFIWQSRRDGYNHLYLYNTTGTLQKQLTSGNFEVLKVIGLDENEESVYITSTEANPIEEHIYKINLKTGKRIRLSIEAGVNNPSISASGNYILNEFTNQQTPKTLEQINTTTKKSIRLLEAKNPYSTYNMPEITIGSLRADDNKTDLYYRLVTPTNFDPTKKYPVIIYVYGGPHSQMIRNSWLGGLRGWDIYMAQKGYIMFSLDNRGTSNRGLEFENIIHRNLGVYETADQMKGVEFLKSLPYVDTKRMGVHGWSYGGFITTNLMLRHSETFKVGVAGGPVIDWKYYEVMYGERYMDTPKVNKKGYENANLNNLAGNLIGHLLLIHDDADATVVWQHSLSFLNACIKARTYPDYFVYPGHEHNVSGPDRVHLHEKITRYFEDYLK